MQHIYNLEKKPYIKQYYWQTNLKIKIRSLSKKYFESRNTPYILNNYATHTFLYIFYRFVGVFVMHVYM